MAYLLENVEERAKAREEDVKRLWKIRLAAVTMTAMFVTVAVTQGSAGKQTQETQAPEEKIATTAEPAPTKAQERTESHTPTQETENQQDGFTKYEIPEEYEKSGGSLPEKYQKYLWRQCEEYGIDFATALAMIEVESGYRPHAESRNGDAGYFQVVEKWHKERMTRLEVSDMKDPYQNTLVALDYLEELEERFGSEDKALTAYNHGVSGAMRDVWTKTGEETSRYSRKVRKIAERIRKELKESGAD